MVLWVLIGWQFTLAEFQGGIVMIVLMALLLRLFVPARLEQQAREHAREADTGHQHHAAAGQMSLRTRINILGVAIFAALFWLTRRRGATDPVCGMKVDRAKAIHRASPAARPTSAASGAQARSRRRCRPRCSLELSGSAAERRRG